MAKVSIVFRLLRLAMELDKSEISESEGRKQITEAILDYRRNPIVSEGISGNPDYPKEFISELDEKWTRWGRFISQITNFGPKLASKFVDPYLPHKKDRKYNERVVIAEQVFPSASSFRTNGFRSFDNPVSSSIAGSTLIIFPPIAKYTVIPLVQWIFGYSDQEVQQFYQTVKSAVDIYGPSLGFTVGNIYSVVRQIKRGYTQRQAKGLSEVFSYYFKSRR